MEFQCHLANLVYILRDESTTNSPAYEVVTDAASSDKPSLSKPSASLLNAAAHPPDTSSLSEAIFAPRARRNATTSFALLQPAGSKISGAYGSLPTVPPWARARWFDARTRISLGDCSRYVKSAARLLAASRRAWRTCRIKRYVERRRLPFSRVRGVAPSGGAGVPAAAGSAGGVVGVDESEGASFFSRTHMFLGGMAGMVY